MNVGRVIERTIQSRKSGRQLLCYPNLILRLCVQAGVDMNAFRYSRRISMGEPISLPANTSEIPRYIYELWNVDAQDEAYSVAPKGSKRKTPTAQEKGKKKMPAATEQARQKKSRGVHIEEPVQENLPEDRGTPAEPTVNYPARSTSEAQTMASQFAQSMTQLTQGLLEDRAKDRELQKYLADQQREAQRENAERYMEMQRAAAEQENKRMEMMIKEKREAEERAQKFQMELLKQMANMFGKRDDPPPPPPAV